MKSTLPRERGILKVKNGHTVAHTIEDVTSDDIPVGAWLHTKEGWYFNAALNGLVKLKPSEVPKRYLDPDAPFVTGAGRKVEPFKSSRTDSRKSGRIRGNRLASNDVESYSPWAAAKARAEQRRQQEQAQEKDA